MKFLAILRDSIREAIDFKVFYVMVTLSVLVALLFACVSFKPSTPQNALPQILLGLPPGNNPHPQSFDPGELFPILYIPGSIKATDESTKPWLDEYRFTLDVTDSYRFNGMFRAVVAQWVAEGSKEDIDLRKIPPAKFLERWRDKDKQVTPEQMEDFLREKLGSVAHLEVTRIKLLSEKHNDAHFEIEARGTPALFPLWSHHFNVFFGAIKTEEYALPLGIIVYTVENYLVGSVGAAITMLISTIITAFFIPNMLRKGSIDLLVSKPISRPVLLIYKYVGGLSFMFMNTLIVALAFWIALGVRTGLWAPGFLLITLIFTFQFATYYAVSTLFAVFTRSPIVAILAACSFWAVLFVAGWTHRIIESTKDMDPKPIAEWGYVTADVVHLFLPRVMDTDRLTTKLLAHELLPANSPQRTQIDRENAKVNWVESIGITLGFITVLLALSCWRFATFDY